jgi:hypothetical protein
VKTEFHPEAYEEMRESARDEGVLSMTIEIHRPELEALIRERMKSGAFQSVEDVLIQALKSAPPAAKFSGEAATRTGADLVAGMQSSPYREIELEPASDRSPVRGITF